MEEQFVSYEIALKLKELGFDECCLAVYFKDKFQLIKGFNINNVDLHVANEMDAILAPLWSQVIDWFLINYNIWISVDTSLIKFYKDDELQSPKFQFIIEDLNNRDADYMFHSADEDLFYFDYKEAREQAILKAIELCKENYHKK